MKKTIIEALVIVFAFFISASMAHAVFFDSFFGGLIINTEAPEITSDEDSGYDCEMQGGSTIQVQIFSGEKPTSFFIPGYVTPVTNTTVASGEQILGIYAGETTIVCTRDDPDDETTGGFLGIGGEKKILYSQNVHILPNIIYFGTSGEPAI